MKRISLGLVYLVFSLLLIGNAQAEQLEVPALNKRVTDLTQSLKPETASKLEASLAQLEQSKGSQVAVLIVLSTAPEGIEDYSLRVVEKWKLGRKDIDDGVLLLVALKDRKMRIEVGYGLEGTIPDISAGRIIREYITPEFREGNIDAGVELGTQQIINLINGESLPEPTTSQGGSAKDPGGILFIMVVASSFLSGFLVPILGRILTVAGIATLGTGVIWFISHDPVFTAVSAIALIIFNLGASGSRGSSYRDGGGYGGGFGGGGSSGGGGFSGGGGGFGGGGASGGW